MFLREARPTFDFPACFICTLAPETEYVDTLYLFEAGGFHPRNGRIHVCRYCIEAMGETLGLGLIAPLKEQIAAQARLIEEMKDNADLVAAIKDAAERLTPKPRVRAKAE